MCLFQAGDASGAAAKRSKSGDDVEIDMREEAQKGRVSDVNQGSGYFVLVFNYEKVIKVATLQEKSIKISLV